ncbi:MAG TPA: DUF885 domain-containing protein [Trebonia sp.]
MSAEGSAGVRAAAKLAAISADYLDDLAERHPDFATGLGDHRFDGRLPERTRASLDAERSALTGFADRLAALTAATGEDSALASELRVDAAMLGNDVARRLFRLEELREETWNPLLANPGRAIYGLLARDFAPLPDRLLSVTGRLAAVPAALNDARGLLGAMPKVHLETAIAQFGGTIRIVREQVDAALAEAPPAMAAEIGKVRPAALEAIAAHRDWLSAKLAGDDTDDGNGNGGFADPRIGPERFARKLSLTLDAEADADAILARAGADLARVTEEIIEVAAALGGSSREVMTRLAADPPDDDTILRFCSDAFTAQTAFVRDHDLVTLYDDPVQIIVMPEVDRGASTAYCDSPGPLEQAPLATFIAVSPTPADWPAERKASYYREQNRHRVHAVLAHEGVPGHYLQLQHSRRFGGATLARSALWSGTFVEGWAVYAEELMAAHGYPGEGDPREFRVQQLKRQLTGIINAILDARTHTRDMTEAEAVALMTGPGFQEESTALVKWRRTLLTSAQLSTYYVGYVEVSELVRELLAVPGATERAVHDRVLAHGSPPVGLLRTLL